MDVADRAALIARLNILEALTVMAVADMYVRRAGAGGLGSEGAAKMAQEDVRRWFAQLLDASSNPVLEAHTSQEGRRVLGAIVDSVQSRISG
ncbi:MAG: hypothetical protein AB7K67_01145 [Hyphomicrobiaceae bacterium]